MAEGKLTERNQRVIDLYLSADEEFQGNGTRCWQEVYGTRDENTAAKNWSRMVRNGKGAEYLARRQQEIRDAVREKVSYEIDDAVKDLRRMQGKAEDNGDIANAIKATVEMVKVQGKYIARTETTQVNASPEDRQWAVHYGMSVTEYLKRKADNTLPKAPPIPDPEHIH